MPNDREIIDTIDLILDNPQLSEQDKITNLNLYFGQVEMLDHQQNKQLLEQHDWFYILYQIIPTSHAYHLPKVRQWIHHNLLTKLDKISITVLKNLVIL